MVNGGHLVEAIVVADFLSSLVGPGFNMVSFRPVKLVRKVVLYQMDSPSIRTLDRLKIGFMIRLEKQATVWQRSVKAKKLICYAITRSLVNICKNFRNINSRVRNVHLQYSNRYQCSVNGVNVTSNSFEIDSFTGTHSLGYGDLNVSYIWFWTGTLQFIPSGIGKIFKNLEVFRVGYDDRNLGLKRLRRSNFMDMESLVHLDVRYNNIQTIDEDTLSHLPNLKYFVVNNNKLKMLHKNTFAKNFKLRQINANSNRLEFLPNDLFDNNDLLEEAHFKHNNLKKIVTHFTHLRSIRRIDFHGNDCIDKVLDDVDNVTEFQTLLKYQCNGDEN